MRLITDVYLSPTQATDTRWAPLSLVEVRDVLAAALDVAGGPVAETILRAVFSGELPARAAVELYLYPAQAQGDGRRQTTLADMIDLASLGSPTQQDQTASQGLFAVAGDIGLPPCKEGSTSAFKP